MTDLLRTYEQGGPDGYPPEWHAEIKHLVRELAGHRCVRCGHPYRPGEHGDGEWSPCDSRCGHEGPFGVLRGTVGIVVALNDEPLATFEQTLRVADGIRAIGDRPTIVARWRILTVHHLNGIKLDCRWWNLAALCQRCHLTIQGRVQLHRVWPWEHSEWFKPYAAGWYAHAYLGEELSREETMARLDELLALERVA